MGSVREGKDPDLVVWNAIPALGCAARPVYSIIDGEVVYQAK